MTDEAKAVEFAELAILNKNTYGERLVNLARSFLALSEKCKRYERVVEAAKMLCFDLYNVKDGAHLPSTSTEKFIRIGREDLIVKALAELEPGDSE